ncbi:hypothetical protein VSDG_04565 [Cytospora chrysosperma]|uniref:6-phosphogluconate dehydrogenase NADP-binding domain-containing protein n=1 Tax=Cytospora chrysosperma TaxID=252740 RepID=A0A423W2X2_CYTCH|nr:hypothetical protein VSDG_04565 [Valsa sordida]
MAYQHPRLGWIGLGSMGLGMATNLQKHLSATGAPGLHYHNRTMSRGDPLEQAGGVPCSSIGDLVARCDIIFMSLSDDSALTSTLDRLVGDDAGEGEGEGDRNGLAGTIVVDTSTVHPSSTANARERLAARGASPVAAQGRLLFVVAGPGAAVEAVGPFLVGVMGRGVIRLGEDVVQSSMLKTAGNFMTAAMMEVVAEAHVLAEKTGLGSEAMESLIEHQYGALALSMSKRLTTGAYMPAKGERPWSDLNLALKDVGHGISCAGEAGLALPISRLVDVDAAGLVLLGLGHGDAQDAVVEVGRDGLLVDAGGEAEGARELADGALRDPELLDGLLLLLLGGGLGGGDLGGGGAGLLGLLGRLVLDGGLVAHVLLVGFAALGDGAAHLGAALDEAGGRRARGVVALGPTRDHEGLRLGELDVDVVLLDAGELTVELVGVLRLLHVEARGEGGSGAAGAMAGAGLSAGLLGVLVEVIQEAEERGERGLRSKVGSWEERHFAGCGRDRSKKTVVDVVDVVVVE